MVSNAFNTLTLGGSPSGSGTSGSGTGSNPSAPIASSGGCGQWNLEDECDAEMLPFGSETILPVAIEDIVSLSSSSNGLVITCRNHMNQYVPNTNGNPNDEAGFGSNNSNNNTSRRSSWAARRGSSVGMGGSVTDNANIAAAAVAAASDLVTVMVTGTLKHTVSTSRSLFMLQDDKLFEYVRGAAMSG